MAEETFERVEYAWGGGILVDSGLACSKGGRNLVSSSRDGHDGDNPPPSSPKLQIVNHVCPRIHRRPSSAGGYRLRRRGLAVP